MKETIRSPILWLCSISIYIRVIALDDCEFLCQQGVANIRYPAKVPWRTASSVDWTQVQHCTPRRREQNGERNIGYAKLSTTPSTPLTFRCVRKRTNAYSAAALVYVYIEVLLLTICCRVFERQNEHNNAVREMNSILP